MPTVLSRLKPQRRAIVAAVIVLVVGCAIALPKLNARAATGLNTISVSDASAKEGTGSDGTLKFTVTVSGLLLGTATVDYHTVDGTATSASGLTQDYVGKTGTLTFSGGSQSQDVLITLKGDQIPEPNETFTLVLSNPTNASLGTDHATGTIENDDVTFGVNDQSVTEGNSGTKTANVEVKLSNASTQTTTVHYATSDGTASSAAGANQDYVPSSGTLTFAPGDTTKTFPVTINGDTASEDDETVHITLTNPTNATIDHADALLTITNDDAAGAPPVVSIDNAQFTEGDGGSTSGSFTLHLTPSSGRTVTVKATTAEGTATSDDAGPAGADYSTRVSTITFDPGATTASFVVPIVGDTLDEPDETFSVTLSNATNATLSTTANVATGTILDDDVAPSVIISSPTANEGDTESFSVALSAISGRDVTVHVGTIDGTAKAPADYTALADKTLTFPAGTNPAQTVDVVTATDTLDEADETFALKVNSVTNATAGPNGTATITDDDPSPSLSIANASVTEGNTGTTPLVFTVTMSTASGRAVTVHYVTVDQSATTADGDYTATSGDLTFGIGETSKTITVNVGGDTKAENDETMRVQLSNAVGASLTNSSATGTITNDDGTPPPPPMFITTGAGAGGGAHVRVLQNNGVDQSPPVGFIAFPDAAGARVARGDLDGDGHDEIIVARGQGQSPVVRVYTSTGTLITETLAYDQAFGGGVFVAVGDINGDGKKELITAAGPGGGPHVRTFDLVNRALVAGDGFFAADPSYSGGLTVASADTNNDGTDEIIVGHATNDQPIVSVWNLNTTSHLSTMHAEFLAYGPDFHGGVNVAAGDLDGDHRAEIVTGTGPGGGPHVRVFSGAGNGLPGSAYAYGADFKGGVTVAIGDVDGDGTNEIITGAGPGGGPHVRTFDELMHPLPYSFMAYGSAFAGGVFVAAGRA